MDNKLKTYLYIVAVLSLSDVTGDSPESKEVVEEFESVHEIFDFESADSFPENFTEKSEDEIPRPIESREKLDSNKKSKEEVDSIKQLEDLSQAYYDYMFHFESKENKDGLDHENLENKESKNLKDVKSKKLVVKIDSTQDKRIFRMSRQIEGKDQISNIESIEKRHNYTENPDELSEINYDIYHIDEGRDLKDLNYEIYHNDEEESNLESTDVISDLNYETYHISEGRESKMDSGESSGDYDYLSEQVDSGELSKPTEIKSEDLSESNRPSPQESRAMGGNFNVMVFNRARPRRKKPQIAGVGGKNKTMTTQAGGVTSPARRRKQQRRFQYIQVQNSGHQTNIRVQMMKRRRNKGKKGGKGGKSTVTAMAGGAVTMAHPTETVKLPNIEVTEPFV